MRHAIYIINACSSDCVTFLSENEWLCSTEMCAGIKMLGLLEFHCKLILLYQEVSELKFKGKEKNNHQ